MAKKEMLVKEIKMSGHVEGTITVSHVEKPYGEYSDPVATIRVSLENLDEADWQVHIPYKNAGEVAAALLEARKIWEEHQEEGYHPHDEVAAETGGGGDG